MGSIADNFEGKRFGRLNAIRRAGTDKNGHVIWFCICDCLRTKNVSASNLKRGHTKSCGCLNDEAITKHGLRNSISYQSWKAMKQRCLNPNDAAYKHYGQRGISIDPNWISSFKKFIEDIGARPSINYSLERKDVNKGYNKHNCIWILKSDQNKNTRRSKKSIYGTTH